MTSFEGERGFVIFVPPVQYQYIKLNKKTDDVLSVMEDPEGF